MKYLQGQKEKQCLSENKQIINSSAQKHNRK